LVAGMTMCCGLVAPAHAQWVPGTWQATRLGFFDSIHTRNDGQQVSSVQGLGLAFDGLTVGSSDRYLGQEFTGSTVWGSTRSGGLQRAGFFDAVHTGANGEQESSIGGQVGLAAGKRSAINALGQTLGYSSRYDGSFVNGRSAWTWSPQSGTTRLGLFSGPFVGSQGEQSSTPVSLNASGRVVGYSDRYDAFQGSNSVPPASAWVFTPGQGHQLIGLIDGIHTRAEDGFQRHEPRGMNDAGVVVGISYRFDTSDPAQPGQSAWVWTAADGARRIGPVGDRYVESFTDLQYAYVLPPTQAGDVAGASWQFAPAVFDVGREAWVVPVGQTQPVILGFKDAVHTGPDGIQRSEPTVLKYDGPLRVAGYSGRYSPSFGYIEGRSAWSWTASEGLIDIGLKDAEHTAPSGNRDSVPIFATPSGAVVGFAQRFSGTFDRTGQSIWVWTPPTASRPQGFTTRLGLTDALHTALDGFQRSEVYGLTDSGYVYGVSYRYNGRLDTDNSVGRTIWVYNISTGQQQSLVFSTSTNGDAIELPLRMTESGVLGGYYLEYVNDEIFAQRAFYWDAARGVTTVNALLQGGPAANLLENAFFADQLDEAAGAGVIYAMPPGVIWNPTGIGSWATAYRIDRVNASNPCDPDVNQDGNADQGDVDYLLNVVAGGENPTEIDPDFNQDGNVDQGDVDALLNVVAGGACP
jgi:hypothetical protein